MITLEQIQAEARKYAKQAQQGAREPRQVWWQDVQDLDSFKRMCGRIPALGDYVHPDWRAFDTNIKGLWAGRVGQSPAPFATYSYAWFFVDSSGWGGDNEAAMSISLFREAMHFLLLAHDAAFGLGIREAGQFQVHIGLYVRTDAQWNGSRFKVASLHELASQPYGTAYKAAHPEISENLVESLRGVLSPPERKDINP